MAGVGIRELKTYTSEVVRRVREEGESIDITYHGEVVARLVPVAPLVPEAAEVAALLTGIDQLDVEIGAYWPTAVSAEDAVRAARREL